MTTNERQNAYETNKNLMANQWKRNTITTNTRKTNKATKREQKGDEKGNSATPARGELYKTMSYGLTSERGNWNCTNAQKCYVQAYLYRAEHKQLASCYQQYDWTTIAR